ncbi:hypothetical protein B0F90DRAFT_1673439 [Multifurca ochricompacta]|uniref:Uncharacterized protein n=1 Tax=Multifurca ochricompacta TaxID=376703 RepID=A0AAD4QPZ7_9AGAM|nr:hypothetical protein B0F90DRAFT_1673439 [Multifurca ochricompacta]
MPISISTFNTHTNIDINTVDRMAEFKAIVTASFDNIGSNVALAIDPYPDLSTSTDNNNNKATRRPPFALSFLRKSLPRSFLTRALKKRPPAPEVQDLDHERSFFDDDDDDDDDDINNNGGNNLGRRTFPRTGLSRRIASAPARSSSRLSSAFAAAPNLFGFSSVSDSTPFPITEQRNIFRADSEADLVHQSSKPSSGLKIRTKISLSKLATSHSYLSSPLTDPSPVTPSFPSHPYSSTHPYGIFCDERSITPEEDPFRRDEIVPALVVTPCDRSPRPGSNDRERRKHLAGRCPLPMPSSRWSSDSDSPPSAMHTFATSKGYHSPPSPRQSMFCASTTPSQSPGISPLSLTFPLPPSVQNSVALTGVTVRMGTPAPTSPPAYPPPSTPLPSGPLPCPPPACTNTASLARPSARRQKEVAYRRHSRRDSGKLIPKSAPSGQGQKWRSHSRVDKSPSRTRTPVTPTWPENKCSQLTSERRTSQKKNRPSTPFPLLISTDRVSHDPTGRLQALEAVTGLTDTTTDSGSWNSNSKWKDSNSNNFDPNADADAIPDSEVEPDRDRDFHSEKARKKTSMLSATSAQSAVSTSSTTSVSTTTSSTSVVTTLTAATTVSPSTSPYMSAEKPNHVSQAMSTAVFSTPSSWPLSPLPANSAAQSARIHVKQSGGLTVAMHEALVMISASGWAQFRSYCDSHGDISLRLAGSSHSSSVADISIVEIQRAGKTRGVELLLIPRSPSLSPEVINRIPGSYPQSLDHSPSLPAIPRISPVGIAQSETRKWSGSALGLEGVPPLREEGCVTASNPSLSVLRPSSDLDLTLDGENQRKTMLAFVAALPTTLGELAKRAGEMSLFDGVATP